MRTDKEIENYIKRHLASPKGGDNVMFAPTVDKDRYDCNYIIINVCMYYIRASYVPYYS